jgi:hypothetical protein
MIMSFMAAKIHKKKGGKTPALDLYKNKLSLVEGVPDAKSKGSGFSVPTIAQDHSWPPIEVQYEGHSIDLEVQSRMRTQGKNVVKIIDQNDAWSDSGVPTKSWGPIELIVIGVQHGDQSRIVLKTEVRLSHVVGRKEIFSTWAHKGGRIPEVDSQTYGALITGLGHGRLRSKCHKGKNKQ